MSPLPGPKPSSWRTRTRAIIHRHGSIALMLLAQLTSAILATIGRVLRTGHAADDSAMGTSEVTPPSLHVQISPPHKTNTAMYIDPPHHDAHHLPPLLARNLPLPPALPPLGPPATRPLLALRGIAGFTGIWGFYYSLRYLALAEASIINFLAPILAVLLLGLFPGAGLSIAQVLAGLISMGGVVCVLQPWSTPVAYTGREQALAIGAAFVGVAGGAVSYVAMARLGNSVHPILTVAYFSTFCVVLSGLSLILQWEALRLPTTALQWGLALVLGVLGFAMHVLLTASLTWEGDSKRPLNFVYTQIVFAMLADKLIWGVAPDGWKYLGAALIVCSAIFVASTKTSHQYALVASDAGEEEDDLELEINKERAEVAKDVEP
ncbi:uncharacterized protein N0V89_000028 [Didymosphaeria variabile]|uniref:EamA domain-containing protein n=1 Tax=Didymosphaeria variabile TaxID=1932322 RepID=A0A9W8XWM8_9PLEO|nr:uncharacterized protein N0V89_000028 [Didymosphaeria variabile]KAJ4359474.1 hypothetical protein N0V89_000028 [Didymosphaeria variabile]